MENPYHAPNSTVLTENDKVIDLLVRFKHQMKVVNMLRQDGMGFDDAQAIVSENVDSARKVLDKKNRFWSVSGAVLLVLSLVFAVVVVMSKAYLNFIAVGLCFVLLHRAIVCFRSRDEITF